MGCVMANKIENSHEEHETKTHCSHYWIIEPAKGPTSKGVCKHCGAEKEFQNSWSDSFWEGDISTLFELPGLPDIEPDTGRGDS